MVQLSEDAYARLTAAKSAGESYSDVVLRLLGKRDPRRFVGSVAVREDMDEIMRKMREAEIRKQRDLWRRARGRL